MGLLQAGDSGLLPDLKLGLDGVFAVITGPHNPYLYITVQSSHAPACDPSTDHGADSTSSHLFWCLGDVCTCTENMGLLFVYGFMGKRARLLTSKST